jgi:hypothetical protein
MRLGSALRVLLLSSIVAACASGVEESWDSIYQTKALSFPVHEGHAVYEGNDPNSVFAPLLLPREMEFRRVTVGQEIPLNSVIVMPDILDEGLLVIEIDRLDLQKDFIMGFFFERDEKVSRHHPFSHVGIEPILTDERLILRLHPSVVLHLRDAMESDPFYQTFVHEKVIGKVTQVNGEVFSTSDHELIKIKLNNFFAMAPPSLDLTVENPKVKIEERSDGSIQVMVPLDALEGPEEYPPVVMEGP